ncbi:hypothetical protein NHX12_002400 [Muraenolepis orangiensis]|uniref:Uncharacterized protein n=1 Tax=Muraenolepis orangiensis TaxID=630683 RepID=A0A9Q0IGC8_9TELE|nr:hypothetical protein NHX12_002400 [Muraenolepis orangiensis]
MIEIHYIGSSHHVENVFSSSASSLTAGPSLMPFAVLSERCTKLLDEIDLIFSTSVTCSNSHGSTGCGGNAPRIQCFCMSRNHQAPLSYDGGLAEPDCDRTLAPLLAQLTTCSSTWQLVLLHTYLPYTVGSILRIITPVGPAGAARPICVMLCQIAGAWLHVIRSLSKSVASREKLRGNRKRKVYGRAWRARSARGCSACGSVAWRLALSPEIRLERCFTTEAIL